MDEDRSRDENHGSDVASDASAEEPVDVAEQPAGLPSHVASSLCYVLSFVSGAVFLLLEGRDKSVRFHAFQSILVGAVIVILEIGIALLGLIPPLGWLLAGILHWIVGIGWVLLSLFLMIKAFGGEEYRLPYIGPRAARLARPFD